MKSNLSPAPPVVGQALSQGEGDRADGLLGYI